MNDSELKGDPKRQRWVLLIAALASALAIRFVYELDRTLDDIMAVAVLNPTRAAEQTLQLTHNFLSGISWILGLIALYLVVQGARIVSAGQYPLPGAKVVLNTKVVFGEAAKRRALIGFTLAALLMVGAFWLPLVGQRYIRQAIVIPPHVEQDLPQILDPDAFPAGVPGPILVDPRNPRHPLNAGRKKPESGTEME